MYITGLWFNPDNTYNGFDLLTWVSSDAVRSRKISAINPAF